MRNHPDERPPFVVSLQPLSHVSILCCVIAASTDSGGHGDQTAAVLVHQVPFSCPLSIVLCQYSFFVSFHPVEDMVIKLQQPNVALVHQMPFLVVCLISVFCVVSVHHPFLYQCSVLCQCIIHGDGGGHGGQTSAVQCGPGSSDAFVLFSVHCLMSVFCVVSLRPPQR